MFVSRSGGLSRLITHWEHKKTWTKSRKYKQDWSEELGCGDPRVERPERPPVLGGTPGVPGVPQRRVGTPVGCTLGEMIQQRQDDPPHRDRDPAMHHLSFWSDKVVRGPWILSHQTEARAGLLWRGGIIRARGSSTVSHVVARTKQNDILREIQILTLCLVSSFSL